VLPPCGYQGFKTSVWHSFSFFVIINKEDLLLPVISSWWLLPGQLGNEARNRKTSKRSKQTKQNKKTGHRHKVSICVLTGSQELWPCWGKYKNGIWNEVPLSWKMTAAGVFRLCDRLTHQRVLGIGWQNDFLWVFYHAQSGKRNLIFKACSHL
jgi:hypothetical protein